MNDSNLPNISGSRVPQDSLDEHAQCTVDQNGSTPYEQGTSIAQAWMEMRLYIRQLHRTTIKTNGSTSHPPSKSADDHIKKLAEKLVDHDPQQLFLRVHQLSYEFCIELKVRLLTTCKEMPGYQEARQFIQGLCECYQWVMNVCETMQNAFQKLDSDHLSMVGLNWITVNMHTFYSTLFTDPDVQEYLTTCVTQVNKVPSATETLGCLFSLKRTLSVAEGLWTHAVKHLENCTASRSPLTAHSSIGVNWTQSNSNCKADSTEQLCTRNAAISNSSESGSCPCRECVAVNDSDMAMAATTENPAEISSTNAPTNCACHFCDSLPNGHQETEVTSIPSLTQLSLYPHIHGSSEILSTPYMPGQAVSKPPAFSNPYLGTDLLTQQLIREWDMTYGDTLAPPGTLSSISDMKKDESQLLANGMQNLSIGQPLNNLSTHSNMFMPLNASSHSLPSTLPNSHPSINTSGVIAHTDSLPDNTRLDKASHNYGPSFDQPGSDDPSASDDSSSQPNSSGNEPDTWISSDGDIAFSYDEDQPEPRKIQSNRDIPQDKMMIGPGSKKPRSKGRYYRSRDLARHPEKVQLDEEDDGTLADFRRRAPDVTITVVKPGQRTDSRCSEQPQVVKIKRSNFKTQKQPPINFPQQSLSDSVQAPPAWVPPPHRTPFSGPATQLPEQTLPKQNSDFGEQKSSLGKILKNLDSASKTASADKDPSSQMVTIKRVVEGVSEPTVTITLKGQEPKEDKVLFKLINGQASVEEESKNVKGMPYEIPEGLSPKEARTYKNRLKKERKKQMMIAEKRKNEEAEEKRCMEIEQQQEFLREQERKIKLQQVALKKQQEELSLKKKGMAEKSVVPPAKKGKKNQTKAENGSKKNLDMTHNFNLPPGVSINKVAGQPGIVTISNNMGNSFCQPFLNNPNMMTPFRAEYPKGSQTSGSSDGNPSLQFFNNSPGSWGKDSSKAMKSEKENVIVVDTKASTNRPKSKEDAIKLWFESLTSEEKVERALLGEVDLSMLNKTQTKKYRKQLKARELEQAAKKEKERVAKIVSGSTKTKPKQPSNVATHKGTKTDNDIKATQKNSKQSNVSQNPPSNVSKTQNKKKDKGPPKVVEENVPKKNKQNKAKEEVAVNTKSKQPTKDTRPKKDIAPAKVEDVRKNVKPQDGPKPVNNKQPVIVDKRESQKKATKKTSNNVSQTKTAVSLNSNKQTGNVTTVENNSTRPVAQKPKSAAPHSRMNSKSKDLKKQEPVVPKLNAKASKVSQTVTQSSTGKLSSNQNGESNIHTTKARNKGKGAFEDSFTIDSVFAPKLNMSNEIVDEAEREVEAFKRFCYDHPRTLGQKPKVDLNVKDIFSKKSLK